jgi:hypothetical protein
MGPDQLATVFDLVYELRKREGEEHLVAGMHLASRLLPYLPKAKG